MLMMHIDVLKIVKVFCKEKICFKTFYCKEFSVIEQQENTWCLAVIWISIDTEIRYKIPIYFEMN